MRVQPIHLIILARNKLESAHFLGGILGLELGQHWAHFLPLRLCNGVTPGFADSNDFHRQHYAFLMTDPEFDAALERIRGRKIAFYAHFDLSGPGEINHLYGVRGVYFHDPGGDWLEIITHPYTSEPQRWLPSGS